MDRVELAGPLYGQLPGYVFDARARGGRYRVLHPDGRLGKFVSGEAIGAQLVSLHNQLSDQLANLATDLADGLITPAVFQRALQQQVKNAALSTTALAHGGWQKVPSAAWGRSGAMLAAEYAFARNFMEVYQRGELTREALIARARLYAGNAYGRYYLERDGLMLASGVKRSRLITSAGACKICLALAAEGWKPIGETRVPVHGHCNCSIRYEERPSR